MAAIELHGLTKTFPGSRRIPLIQKRSPPVTAVEDVDLTVEEGEVFGFLGPNGAGKSTTINLLLDYFRPTSGSAEVFGLDVQEDTLKVHDCIGVLPERLALWPRLTARDHLRVAARTKDVPVAAERMLERVELGNAIDRPVGEFSTGMRQRLGLAMALVGDPELLILDEPTAGLDPNGVRRLREIIRAEVDRGVTVFFSSHVLDQVEAVCDRVAILDDGELVAVDTVEGLRKEVDATVTLSVRLGDRPDGIVAAVQRVDGVTDAVGDGDELVATCTFESAKVDVLDAVREAGATVEQFDSETADLETLFSDYAGGGAPDDGELSRGGGNLDSGGIEQ